MNDGTTSTSQEFDFDPKSPRLKLIAGDASDRKFYRFQAADASYICMQFPTWAGGYGGDPLSWLGMHQALLQWQIPLPDVVKVDEENACIWTSDLGDDFLNRNLGALHLDATKPELFEIVGHYRQALSLLVTAQYPPHSKDIAHPAKDRFFDQTKLFFELNFFGEHFLKGLLGQSEVTPALLLEWQTLAGTISARERVLCHRDYHARNLMLKNGTVYWIDFQDARMGPHTYDVVSLLRDSYVKFEEQTRELLFNEYLDELNAARTKSRKIDRVDRGNTESKEPISASDFFRERQLVGLQRNIKALGSFAYLYLVKKKKVYLSFVTNTVDLILKESLASEVTVQYPETFLMLKNLQKGSFREVFEALIERGGIDQF